MTCRANIAGVSLHDATIDIDLFEHMQAMCKGISKNTVGDLPNTLTQDILWTGHITLPLVSEFLANDLALKLIQIASSTLQSQALSERRTRCTKTGLA